jgi:hypothetical protein
MSLDLRDRASKKRPQRGRWTAADHEAQLFPAYKTLKPRRIALARADFARPIDASVRHPPIERREH